MKKLFPFTTMLLASIYFISGCSSGGADLKKQDPDGYAACEALSNARGTTSPAESLNSLFEAGEYAAKAETPEIYASVEDQSVITEGVPPLVETNVLVSACEENGFKIADVQEKSAD